MYSTLVFATGLHLRRWKAFAVSAAAADGDDEDDGAKLRWLLMLHCRALFYLVLTGPSMQRKKETNHTHTHTHKVVLF